MYKDGLVFTSKEAIQKAIKRNNFENLDQRRAFQSYISYKIFCYRKDVHNTTLNTSI